VDHSNGSPCVFIFPSWHLFLYMQINSQKRLSQIYSKRDSVIVEDGRRKLEQLWKKTIVVSTTLIHCLIRSTVVSIIKLFQLRLPSCGCRKCNSIPASRNGVEWRPTSLLVLPELRLNDSFNWLRPAIVGFALPSFPWFFTVA